MPRSARPATMAASLRAAATRILRPARFPGAGVRRLAEGTPHSVSHNASQIKHKKEELFNLISEAEADSAATWFDKLLLKDLSTQVEPRPFDPIWRKIIAKKVVTTYTLVAGALVTSGLILRSLTEIVEYNGHLVSAESLPVLKGYQPAATAEGVHKQDGYQPVSTAGGVYKQEELQKQMD